MKNPKLNLFREILRLYDSIRDEYGIASNGSMSLEPVAVLEVIEAQIIEAELQGNNMYDYKIKFNNLIDKSAKLNKIEKLITKYIRLPYTKVNEE